MKQELLEKLSIGDLESKATNPKALIGLFIPIIIVLFFFAIRDYFRGEEVDMSSVNISICSIGGPVTLFPELRSIQQELRKRE